MLIVGIICLILGFLLGINILWVIGVILTVIGLILLLMGSTRTGGHHWY
jgi:hypothetical protein